MLVLVYIECAFVALLTLGYLKLLSIGITVSTEPIWYKFLFFIVGTYSLISLWWILIMGLRQLKNKHHGPIPILIKGGVGVGFIFAAWLVLYPWLYNNSGYVQNDFPVVMLFLVSLPSLIAVHVFVFLKRGKA